MTGKCSNQPAGPYTCTVTIMLHAVHKGPSQIYIIHSIQYKLH